MRKNKFLKGGFFLFMYDIQHCFICRPSGSTVSEDAGIEQHHVFNVVCAFDEKNINIPKVKPAGTGEDTFHCVQLLE
jgi:hypothetical protein